MKGFFKGKTVWVTGASSGIGKALVSALAGQGAQIVLSSRKAKQLQEVAGALALPPDRYLILPLDLSDYGQLDKTPEKVIEKFGKLDVLINNGGISQRSYFVETELAVFQKIMDTNFMGAVALSKAALPYLLKSDKGTVVAVSSVVGKYGTPLRTAYSASKHALHGFFDALRAELHTQGLQVMLACPGYIKTNISYNALTGDGAAQEKMDKGQAGGLSPAFCAEQILKGIRKGKNEIYIGGMKEVGGVYLKRLFPALFAKIVRKVNVR